MISNRNTILTFAFMVSCVFGHVGEAAETTLVCDKGRYHNTCLDNNKSVSVQKYVREHSKYKKIESVKRNKDRLEINVKEK